MGRMWFYHISPVALLLLFFVVYIYKYIKIVLNSPISITVLTEYNVILSL